MKLLPKKQSSFAIRVIHPCLHLSRPRVILEMTHQHASASETFPQSNCQRDLTVVRVWDETGARDVAVRCLCVGGVAHGEAVPVVGWHRTHLRGVRGGPRVVCRVFGV